MNIMKRRLVPRQEDSDADAAAAALEDELSALAERWAHACRWIAARTHELRRRRHHGRRMRAACALEHALKQMEANPVTAIGEITDRVQALKAAREELRRLRSESDEEAENSSDSGASDAPLHAPDPSPDELGDKLDALHMILQVQAHRIQELGFEFDASLDSEPEDEPAPASASAPALTNAKDAKKPRLDNAIVCDTKDADTIELEKWIEDAEKELEQDRAQRSAPCARTKQCGRGARRRARAQAGRGAWPRRWRPRWSAARGAARARCRCCTCATARATCARSRRPTRAWPPRWTAAGCTPTPRCCSSRPASRPPPPPATRTGNTGSSVGALPLLHLRNRARDLRALSPPDSRLAAALDRRRLHADAALLQLEASLKAAAAHSEPNVEENAELRKLRAEVEEIEQLIVGEHSAVTSLDKMGAALQRLEAVRPRLAAAAATAGAEPQLLAKLHDCAAILQRKADELRTGMERLRQVEEDAEAVRQWTAELERWVAARAAGPPPAGDPDMLRDLMRAADKFEEEKAQYLERLERMEAALGALLEECAGEEAARLRALRALRPALLAAAAALPAAAAPAAAALRRTDDVFRRIDRLEAQLDQVPRPPSALPPQYLERLEPRPPRCPPPPRPRPPRCAAPTTCSAASTASRRSSTRCLVLPPPSLRSTWSGWSRGRRAAPAAAPAAAALRRTDDVFRRIDRLEAQLDQVPRPPSVLPPQYLERLEPRPPRCPPPPRPRPPRCAAPTTCSAASTASRRSSTRCLVLPPPSLRSTWSGWSRGRRAARRRRARGRRAAPHRRRVPPHRPPRGAARPGASSSLRPPSAVPGAAGAAAAALPAAAAPAAAALRRTDDVFRRIDRLEAQLDQVPRPPSALPPQYLERLEPRPPRCPPPPRPRPPRCAAPTTCSAASTASRRSSTRCLVLPPSSLRSTWSGWSRGRRAARRRRARGRRAAPHRRRVPPHRPPRGAARPGASSSLRPPSAVPGAAGAAAAALPAAAAPAAAALRRTDDVFRRIDRLEAQLDQVPRPPSVLPPQYLERLEPRPPRCPPPPRPRPPRCAAPTTCSAASTASRRSSTRCLVLPPSSLRSTWSGWSRGRRAARRRRARGRRAAPHRRRVPPHRPPRGAARPGASSSLRPPSAVPGAAGAAAAALPAAAAPAAAALRRTDDVFRRIDRLEAQLDQVPRPPSVLPPQHLERLEPRPPRCPPPPRPRPPRCAAPTTCSAASTASRRSSTRCLVLPPSSLRSTWSGWSRGRRAARRRRARGRRAAPHRRRVPPHRPPRGAARPGASSSLRPPSAVPGAAGAAAAALPAAAAPAAAALRRTDDVFRRIDRLEAQLDQVPRPPSALPPQYLERLEPRPPRCPPPPRPRPPRCAAPTTCSAASTASRRSSTRCLVLPPSSLRSTWSGWSRGRRAARRRRARGRRAAPHRRRVPPHRPPRGAARPGASSSLRPPSAVPGAAGAAAAALPAAAAPAAAALRRTDDVFRRIDRLEAQLDQVPRPPSVLPPQYLERLEPRPPRCPPPPRPRPPRCAAPTTCSAASTASRRSSTRCLVLPPSSLRSTWSGWSRGRRAARRRRARGRRAAPHRRRVPPHRPPRGAARPGASSSLRPPSAVPGAAGAAAAALPAAAAPAAAALRRTDDVFRRIDRLEAQLDQVPRPPSVLPPQTPHHLPLLSTASPIFVMSAVVEKQMPSEAECSIEDPHALYRMKTRYQNLRDQCASLEQEFNELSDLGDPEREQRVQASAEALAGAAIMPRWLTERAHGLRDLWRELRARADHQMLELEQLSEELSRADAAMESVQSWLKDAQRALRHGDPDMVKRVASELPEQRAAIGVAQEVQQGLPHQPQCSERLHHQLRLLQENVDDMEKQLTEAQEEFRQREEEQKEGEEDKSSTLNVNGNETPEELSERIDRLMAELLQVGCTIIISPLVC
ncbi:hypothetical protein ACJJTC_014539 [Scirpophaga incertulas]